MNIAVEVEKHPLLDARLFTATFPRPLASMSSPEWLLELLDPQAEAPLRPDEEVRRAIRELLRHGGFKPSGRSKPASEYLARIAEKEGLFSINPAVDACNAVSLHSGIPASVIDQGRAVPPFRIAIAPEGARYVFNPAGQTIELGGLLCLFDAEGPCANAVKDAQRTKTTDDTREILCVLWGSTALGKRTAEAERWFREILERLGAETRGVHP